MNKIRKGDLVQVISGADRGKQGRVIGLHPSKDRVRVEKVRMQKRHLKPGRAAARTGGIIEREGFIQASNVMLVDSDANAPSRVRVQKDGNRRVRIFAKSGKEVPQPTQG